jgi:CHAT domain-containing protein
MKLRIRSKIIILFLLLFLSGLKGQANALEILDIKSSTYGKKAFKLASLFYIRGEYRKSAKLYDLYLRETLKKMHAKDKIKLPTLTVSDQWNATEDSISVYVEEYKNDIDSALVKINIEYLSQGIIPPLVGFIRNGEILTHLGEFETAYIYFSSAFNFVSTENMGEWGRSIKADKRAIISQLHISLAIALSEGGDFSAALHHMRSALDYHRITNDKFMLGKCYQLNAAIELEMGELHMALAQIINAEKLHRDRGTRLTVKQFHVMEELDFLGSIGFTIGSVFSPILYRMSNTQVRVDEEKLEPIKELLQDLVLKSEIQLLMGDYEPALATVNEALQIAEQENFEYGIAISNEKLAMIMRVLGDLTEAKRKLIKALEVNKKLGTKPAIFENYMSLIKIILQTGDHTFADDYLEQVFRLATEMGSPLLQAQAHHIAGMVNKARGHNEKSLEDFKEAVEYAEQSDTKKLGVYLTALASGYLSTGNLESAKDMLEKAGPLVENLASPEASWNLEMRKAEYFTDAGDTTQAVASFRGAIEITENSRSGLSVDVFKSGFFEDKSIAYSRLAALLISTGRIEESYSIAEQAKARTFVDMLAQKRVTLSDSSSNALRDEYIDLQRQMSSYDEKLYAISDNTEDSKKIQRIIDNSVERKETLRSISIELEREIEQKEPRLMSLVSAKTLELADIQSLLSPGILLIEFMATEQTLLRWTVNDSSYDAWIIPIPISELEGKVRSLRKAIFQAEETESVEKSFAEIGSLIFQGIDFQDVEKIVIVPHGPLHYLPFQAMKAGNKLLVEIAPITYVPSATALKYCLDNREDRTLKSLFALGDPDTDPDLALPALPGARTEVSEVSSIFPDSKCLFGADASETVFRQVAGNYDILHLACHGQFFETNPGASCVHLGQDGKNDGRLEMSEIVGLKLRSSLVVLSACETGLGKLTKGDEMIGMTRSFIYAGTPSVVSSLWSVSDASTSYLMRTFYNNMIGKGMDKSLALQQATLSTREKYPSPFQWAAFVLTGDWE